MHYLKESKKNDRAQDLQNRFRAEGYLFFRDFFPKDLIFQVREKIIDILHAENWGHYANEEFVAIEPVHRINSIALEKKTFRDVILQDLYECPSALWRLFLAWECRPLTHEEWGLIHQFINQVRQGIEQALNYDTPILILAHGGTYWALSHLLNLQGERKIGNCILKELTPNHQGWEAKTLLPNTNFRNVV